MSDLVNQPGFDPSAPIADPVAATRPDPNVKAPAARHRLDVDGTAMTAGLYRALPGGGEDIWQILDDQGQIVVSVVADKLAEAVADRQEHGDRQRARAQQFLDAADQADTERTVITALAEQVGVDVTAPPRVEQPPPLPPHPAR